jgi:hypothetical protein
MGISPATEVPDCYGDATQERLKRRLERIETHAELGLLEAPEFKRKWEPIDFEADLLRACFDWLASRVEDALQHRTRPATVSHLTTAIQDDARVLALAEIYQNRRDVDLTGLVREIIIEGSVPSHPYHTYTDAGLPKRIAWEQLWSLQRRKDAGEAIADISTPPEYSQGSRGKSTDFLRNEYWQLRGNLDVPSERFVAFTEVPGRTETLYGWAGWTPLERLRALLVLDEELEDAGVTLADRAGLLDSAWRLLPDVAREDAAAANRLKAELQALVGADGPSCEILETWRGRFPPPGTRSKRGEMSETREQEVRTL